MNKKQAIQALTKQREKLKEDFILLEELWYIQTRSYLEEIFGENSHEYLQFLTYLPVNHPEYFNKPVMDERHKAGAGKLTKFLNNCIETVGHKGVYRKPKVNFLQNFTDAQVVGALFTIAVTLATLAYNIGRWAEKQESTSTAILPGNKSEKEKASTDKQDVDKRLHDSNFSK